MKIVFMGTPAFAVTVLDRIIGAGHEVVGVVTTPDKPAGRGQHLKFSDVKQYAVEHQLALYQPEKLKDPTFVEAMQQLKADAFVVVAFRMLPACIYNIPPMGTFNVHASLLPQYRGAAPIQWAIMNGETETGVTTFLLDEHTDTGAIIGQSSVAINPEETAGTLHDKLMEAGANLAVETLHKMETHSLEPKSQIVNEPIKTAPKIFKEDMHIHWNETAEHIANKIRGLSPYPGAFTFLTEKKDGKKVQLKIFECSLTDLKSADNPGSFLLFEQKYLKVATKTYDILLKIIQVEGKKMMKTSDFISGFRFENYTNIFI